MYTVSHSLTSIQIVEFELYIPYSLKYVAMIITVILHLFYTILEYVG